MPNLKKQEDDLQLLATVNTNFDDVSVSITHKFITHKFSLYEFFSNLSLHYNFLWRCWKYVPVVRIGTCIGKACNKISNGNHAF